MPVTSYIQAMATTKVGRRLLRPMHNSPTIVDQKILVATMTIVTSMRPWRITVACLE
jgi:hypothetical protein